MSLSGALNNALSGLTANVRAAGLVSSNIANATTESYGRRTLDLSSGQDGGPGGVRVDGTLRHVNQSILSDRRQSDAAFAEGESLYTFSRQLELAVGDSDTPGSLTDRVTAFENALLTAAGNPSSTQRLEMVSNAADALADTLNTLSSGVQQARSDADRAISTQVETLNTTLGQVDVINQDIVSAKIQDKDASGLMDERQRLIDSIADIVPLRTVQRDNGEVALYSTGGAVLLDGNPIEIGFDPTPFIGANQTLQNGALSGLTMNGNPVTAPPGGMFRGGDLAAQFEIRDSQGTTRQAELDGIARDLIERLGPGGPDASLGATDPGLFTDAGIAFDSLNETGIAGRVALNDLVAPGSGGSWRMRDGLGATTQGPVGDARLLQGVGDALAEISNPSSAALAPVSRSFADRVADFSSDVASSRVRDEANKTYQATQHTILSELELSEGVDTDQELQRLMQIEQQYTANARVMTAVDQMLERLMSI